MEGFNQLTAWAAKAWGSATLTGRIISVLAGTLMVATIAGAAIWSSMPDYKLLRDGIAPAATADIVSALNASSIPNKMNYSGTGVLVPASRWNEANITISTLSSDTGEPPATSTNPLFLSRPGHSETVRAKELALERSLESLRVVKSADVHLAIPEPSPFRTKRQPPSASVIIEPKANQMISHEMATGIIHTVAAAVEGLDPKNVTLADADGGLVGNGANSDPAAIRRDYVSDLETSLAMKAQDLLAAVLGPNRSVIRVTAEVDDFLDKVTTKLDIDVAGKARIEEKITSSDQQGVAASAGGVAGTSSNDASALLPGMASDQQIRGKSETIDTTYEYPETKQEIREIGGQIRRLSISATVDATQETGDPAVAATSILTQDQVEGIIKSAVGFNTVRGDQLQVVMQKFSDVSGLVPELPLATDQKWAFVSQLARNASLGLAAIVALLLGVMTLNKLKPIEIPANTNVQHREVLSVLSDRVENNPEAVSKILAAWIGQESADEEPSTVPMKKAA